MGYPPPPMQPSIQPQRSVADLTVSLIILAFTVLLGGAAALFGLLSLAFLDYCPPESCSVNGAITTVLGSLIGAGIVGIGGLILTVIRLNRRQTAWPFALVTLGLCALTLLAGGLGFLTAVGQ